MSTRVALIVIGTYKQDWWGLAPVARADFISRVGEIARAAQMEPQTGYRLAETPGAFLEVWEGKDRASVDLFIEDLKAMGYTRFVDARWLIGERELQTPKPAPRTRRVARTS